MSYFDYTANTPACKEALQRFCEVERGFIGNANSNHGAGHAAKAFLAQVTDSIAKLLGVNPDEIIYTSGASESNNTAIRGIVQAKRHVGKHIVTNPLEHSSVSATLTALQEAGYEIEMAKIGTDGKIDLEDLKSLLRKDTVLVTVNAVDSELGTVQPLEAISKIVREFPSCSFHVDATQAIGKTPINLNLADTASIGAHKFYGLSGSGLLYKKSGIAMEPLIYGGASTTIYRSGTPTLALDASLETALSLAVEHFEERFARVKELRKILQEKLCGYPKVRINSPADAVPHILNLSVAGVRGNIFQKALSDKGIYVSVKSACSVDALPSRAVFAVCRDRKNALNSWRISLSHLTTEKEIDEFMAAFDSCYKELCK